VCDDPPARCGGERSPAGVFEFASWCRPFGCSTLAECVSLIDLRVSGPDRRQGHAEVIVESDAGCFPNASAASMLRTWPAGIASDVHVPAPHRLSLANACVVSIALDEAALTSPKQLIIPADSKTAMLRARHNACDLLGLAYVRVGKMMAGCGG
jgi:hypothetical protein